MADPNFEKELAILAVEAQKMLFRRWNSFPTKELEGLLASFPG
jgi:hypothetical protein